MGQECQKASGSISERKAPGALSDKHTVSGQPAQYGRGAL